MARKPVTDMSAWPSLSLEGNLIAPAMVAQVAAPKDDLDNQQSYRIRKGLTIREEISTAFRVGQSHFDTFAKIANPSADATRRFIKAFLQETFSFDDLVSADGALAFIAGGRVPIVVVPPSDEKLDRRSATLSTDRTRSPAFALQDHLNEHDETLWGLVTNGTLIRLMRDNASLTRPAYIEADLSQIFTNEDAASFAVLWLLIHRTRFGVTGAPATDCALERWRDAGSKEGEVARDRLAVQVQLALKVLGSGFLEANPDLRDKLKSGEINLTEWFNELLRLVYRLIFLMVAEDRNLLHPDKAKHDARKLYAEGYSLAALRAQCYRAASWDKHHDRYEGIKIVFHALANGQDALALPALGGLFSDDKLPHLETARLRNRAFMEALYRLSWLDQKTGMVPVNWRAMETEELGSVYESLLELQPQLGDDGKTLLFASEAAEQKGNQRKTTGSYYTPDSLVQALLDTALDPVLDKTEAEADDPAKALLKLSIIDPACGSGHFLLAAARRIATRLARIRADGTPALADFRHALRDVARSCLHGVDRNPMAVELTKVALWIETVDPGLPLGFFDAQIRCGDALLGVFDLKVLQGGIPDAAYKPLTSDDKDTARYYLQANRAATSGQAGFDFGTGQVAMPEMKPLALDFSGFRDLPEDTVEQIGAKAARFKELRKGQAFVRATAAANLYVAAFLLPKVGGAPAGASARTVPTTEELWMALNQGKIRNAMMDAPKAARRARAFHWPLEFPDVLQRGGFDVVLGNPPYGAEVEARAKECIKCTHPQTAGASNTCADFISLAVGMMSEKGMFGLVVPKSVTYSNAWRGVRAIALPRLVSTVDIGQAWANVALEMVLLFCSKGRQDAIELHLFRSLGSPVMAVPRALADGLGIIPTGLSDQDQEALAKIRMFLKPNRISEFSTSRGKGLQKLAREEGDVELLAGRNIAPMQLRDPWRYINSGQIEGSFLLPEGAVVFQNIVAHLLNPTDHIRLIGAVTDRPTVPLDTVNIIHHPQAYSNRSVAAYLMSDFICWFVYVGGFNRAVRTMHFDNYILEKLPSVPHELFKQLDDVVPEHLGELTAKEWRSINDIVNRSYGLDGEISSYLNQMHSQKGS
ncbi:Eco57I restriction-modification methylase domain-containing protein [Cypionkella sp. TWP1-2-1b2]|uniref:Eco57I restriction-modification methylase domain-containing protein n=1 Tax=Cypionkella sp. TWP1-2-1b2 TaxID=2804675 RepID=UPI003CE86A8D